MPSLQNQLRALAQSFADNVLAAIRTASLDDLTGTPGGGGGRRPAPTSRGGTTAGSPKTTKKGRLARRSPEDIEKTLGLVVAAIKGTKGKGMRSEEIRKFLKLDVREVPRVLKHGLETKKLKSKGQKRATTYFVAA
jgi:hypothetical protein